MKLLLTGRLADRNFLHHIYPISLIDDVDEIMVVRDSAGIAANKIKYYCPPKWSLKFLPLAFVFKFFMMLYLSITKKPSIINGYLLFPHASMAFIVGKLTGRKVGTSLIAGPVELYVSSSPVGTYSYCNPLPPLTLRAKIFKWILNESDLITVTGNYTKDFLTSVGINDKLMVTMPHAIDRRFKLKDANKEYDLIFVGRLVKVKHIDVLLKAINIVKKLKPDIKVVIVGDGPCKSKLEKLSNDFNLINNVHFAGYQQNVWEWYSKAKISILTSEREGFPYSVVESLKCGVPVIASDCGDVQDLIINGYNGMIVKRYDDYQAFADKIIEILQDNAKLESYSSNSLESVSNITMENLASIWEKDILARLNKE